MPERYLALLKWFFAAPFLVEHKRTSHLLIEVIENRQTGFKSFSFEFSKKNQVLWI